MATDFYGSNLTGMAPTVQITYKEPPMKNKSQRSKLYRWLYLGNKHRGNFNQTDDHPLGDSQQKDSWRK